MDPRTRAWRVMLTLGSVRESLARMTLPLGKSGDPSHHRGPGAARPIERAHGNDQRQSL